MQKDIIPYKFLIQKNLQNELLLYYEFFKKIVSLFHFNTIFSRVGPSLIFHFQLNIYDKGDYHLFLFLELQERLVKIDGPNFLPIRTIFDERGIMKLSIKWQQVIEKNCACLTLTGTF